MLSYQHSYHAGNHADILKHWVLLACVRHLQKKPKPFDYIDTHAGAGLYRLDSSEAQKTGEYLEGVARLSGQVIAGMEDYLVQVGEFLVRRQYPGSPMLVNNLLRAGDHAWLYELHPATINQLRQHCEKPRVSYVRHEDGFKGLLGQLPSKSRRALALIDPSYEVKSDYKTVVDVITAGWKKAPNTLFLLWYPVVDRRWTEQMERSLARSPMRNVQLFEMGVAADNFPGMTASGMVVVNAPWTLAERFHETMPAVSRYLSADNQSRVRHEILVPE